MAARVASWLSRPGLLRGLATHARLALRLLREPRVPVLAKAVPLLGIVYVISPLDVVPDFLPVLGQLDDLGIIVLALEVFIRMSPPDVVAYHVGAINAGRPYTPMAEADPFIDAQWRRE